MRVPLVVLFVAMWLITSPLAQAVECVMKQPVAAAVETYHCPMMREMAEQATPKMTVAECFEFKSIVADAVLGCPVYQPGDSVVLPVAVPAKPALPVIAWRMRAPPDIGLMARQPKVVVLQQRLRI